MGVAGSKTVPAPPTEADRHQFLHLVRHYQEHSLGEQKDAVALARLREELHAISQPPAPAPPTGPDRHQFLHLVRHYQEHSLGAQEDAVALAALREELHSINHEPPQEPQENQEKQENQDHPRAKRPGPRGPPLLRRRPASSPGRRRPRPQAKPAHPLCVDPALVVMGPATPFAEVVCGPVLFTAPHGLRVWRDGEAATVEGLSGRRVHLRERFTTELALRMAAGCAEAGRLGVSGSAVVWNCSTARKEDSSNLDPNYLTCHEFSKSPWHAALTHFRRLFRGRPVLHVDLHGKKDRRGHATVDVGGEALRQVWPHAEQAELLVRELGARLRAACEGVLVRGHPVGVDTDPHLSGFWGDHGGAQHTMAHQAALLGIPSVQLELPLGVRKALMRDRGFFDRFLGAVTETYRETVGRHLCPSPLRLLHFAVEEPQERARAAAAAAERRLSLGEYALVPGRVMVGGSARVGAVYERLLEETRVVQAKNKDRQI